MNRRASVDAFLEQKRIAFVGVSSKERHFSRSLFREFVQRGYDVVPVNPKPDSVEGKQAFASVSAIEPKVDSVLVITPASQTAAVVEECAAAGVQRIWMYRATGPGSVDPKAVEFCKQKGIDVVAGECPHMFFPNAMFFHRFHGFVKKIVGAYPN